MLSEQEIGLIEPHDETPLRDCNLQLVIIDQRIEVPIPQLTGNQIALLTLLLAAIGTPLCIALYSTLKSSDFGVTAAAAPMVGACWILGVLGPAAFRLFLPVGWWRPDHWIRFDRESGILSIRGGYSEFHRDEIVALLSVTDLRKKKRQTEFQVITACSATFSKHFVANCREVNPSLAFASLIKEIGRFSRLPCWIAMINSDGSVKLEQIDLAE